jgi:membrane protease YdiL (CAAX protease family)
MLYQIDPTRMIIGAKESLWKCKRNLPVFLELLIFLLVSTVASVPQSIISSFAITFIILFDPKFHEMIEQGNFDNGAVEIYTADLIENMPSSVYALLLFSAGFMVVVSLLYCHLFEKRKPYTLGFTKRGCVSEYLLGLLIGLGMIAVPILACQLTDCIDIAPSTSVKPFMILAFFIAFLFQGMGEEALFRGYLMTSLARKTHVWVAVIISSLLFSLFHLSNASFSLIAFINIFLFGLFSSIFMLKRGSIWAVGAIHAIWNFVQGNLFGFNVSGNPKFDSIMEVTQKNYGSILHGADFGPEGGLAVTVVLLIMIAVALAIPTKKSERIEMAKPNENNG